MRILGIETSCDETAAAVVEVHGEKFTVHSNIVASQIKIHAKNGGVVPEVAARAHVEAIIPVIERALKETKSVLTKLPAAAGNFVKMNGEEIDVIAVTAGPGLMTSLLVGVEVARTLSALWKKPLVAVNHLAGHVYANWLPTIVRHSEEPCDEESYTTKQGTGSLRTAQGRLFAGLRMTNISFPALCLIVSGGHTELVFMRRHMDFEIIGSTRDDAAGEAFDKVAKMLNLRYPGGPEVARLAEQFTVNSSQYTVKFPRPMITSSDFDFSFSGLKTSVLYFIKTLKHENTEALLPEICYEFQEAAVEVLVAKTIRAAKQYKVKTVLLGGGVAANARLRQQLVNAVNRELSTVNYILPEAEYTGDNAAMIAAAGYFMARAKQFTPWKKIDVDPNWQLGTKFNPIPR